MNNLKISTRLLALVGTLSALLVGIGLLGLYGISKANEGLQKVYEHNAVPMGQIAGIQERLLANRLALAVALVTPDPQTITQKTTEVEANIAAITGLWDRYVSIATDGEQREQALAKAFAADRTRFVQEGLRPAIAALRAGDVKGANRVVVDAVRPLYEPVDAGIKALMKFQLDGARHEYETATTRYEFIRNVSIASVTLGVLAAALLGTFLIRAISRSLSYAVEASNAVARGDLSHPIQVRGRDEIAALLQALSAMKDNLARVVADVRRNAEGVAVASAQIAQGNNDLSSRTEEQASALEQTAASMEELNAAVKQNAENACQADQLAKGASDIAAKGGQVVDQFVQTMQGINESSKKIADIITVIDGIAFQTNILSLNAAVEAARAGEQGRGFAVVASEVRSLAQRSAEAAREIRALIGASVERVEQGSRLVDEAGETMVQVVNAIQRVTDIMGDISTASLQQSSGVSQVGEAVSQMDQTTQQNAALVEESASAAECLKSQAQDLVSAVAVFRLAAADSIRRP